MLFKTAAAILLSFVCFTAASQNCFRKLPVSMSSPAPPQVCLREISCRSCDILTGKRCVACVDQYFLDLTTSKCAQCIANCYVCYQNEPCHICKDTFYGAKCDKKCFTGCKVCKDEQSCEICNDGLFGTVCDQKCFTGCKTCKDNKTCEICTSPTEEFINGKCQAAASGLIFGAFLLLLSLACY